MLPSRRGVLKLIPGAAAMLRLRAADMIIRSARPEDFEMPLDGFNTWITPTERFFVRTHVYTPKVDLAGWQLRVEGEVAQPLSLSLADLREFPRAELVSVLECAGNGRAFFRPMRAKDILPATASQACSRPLPWRPALRRDVFRRTCCGIHSPRTCWRTAPTYAVCNRCWAMPTSRRRKSIPMFWTSV